jgi:hypothetical protein
MTRDEFRNLVLARDAARCCVCRWLGSLHTDELAVHHIMERRLWDTTGPQAYGYVLDNGATLCPQHHMEAETTDLSCDEIRQAAGIGRIVLPPHLTPDETYDKWGNVVLPNGTRLRGELFEEPSVQKILAPYLSRFEPYVKYPRTPHVRWSPGCQADDIQIAHEPDPDDEIIQTVKMDGENTTLYRDRLHARSLNANPHPSRGWVKNLHAQMRHDIPEGWRVCGENLYAQHSIAYRNLESYFLVFSI